MSTKAIRKALERLATLEDGSTPEVIQALLEVEMIERASRAIRDGDRPYALADARHLMTQIAEDAP